MMLNVSWKVEEQCVVPSGGLSPTQHQHQLHHQHPGPQEGRGIGHQPGRVIQTSGHPRGCGTGEGTGSGEATRSGEVTGLDGVTNLDKITESGEVTE